MQHVRHQGSLTAPVYFSSLSRNDDMELDMGDSSRKDGVERRDSSKDRRDDVDGRRGKGRVVTEEELRRKKTDRRKG